VSKREYARLSGKENIRTEAPKIKYENWKNKRTGKIEKVPEGIDPGWDYNVGKDRKKMLAKQLSEKKKKWETVLNHDLPD
jgi:hypothetical protein